MKLNKYIGLAAMPLLFAACQNDTLGETLQQENGIFTLSGSMPGGTAMSRAQIALGNTDSSKESFLWNEGDQFALYQGSDENLSSHVFTISSDYRETGDGDKKNATFTTDNPAQAMKYVAIYPADVMINKSTAEFNLQHDLDFSSATTLEEQNLVWKDYLQNNMFMMANGELSSSGDNIVNFSHLCAMIRITYTNKTADKQNIDFIRLGGEQGLTTGISYYIPGEYQKNGGGMTNWYQINTPGLIVEAGVTTDFYIMFFPSTFENRLDFTLRISGEERQVGVDVADIAAVNNGAQGFEAGKRYWFKLTGYDTGMVLSKDYTTDVATIENPLLAVALRDVLGTDMVAFNEEDSTATISVMDARAVKELRMDDWRLNSLEGIEHFSNLEKLYVGRTGVKTFDASVLPKLRELDIYANNLTTLNLKGCSELVWISCENNLLTELDLSDLTKLSMFNCSGNLIRSLDFSSCKNIEWLGCEDNLLTELDLSMMVTKDGYYLLGGQGQKNGENLTITVKMTDAWKDTWYSSLDQGYNNIRVVIEGEVTPADDEFMISNKGFATALLNVLGADKVTVTESGRAIMKTEVASGITSLNLNGQTGISKLTGLEYFVNLEQLWADEVGLEGNIDYSQNQSLKYLDLSRNPGITDIHVFYNLNLTHLFLVNSPIYNLDVSQNANLESLLVVNSNIWRLNVGNNPKLNHLNCRENRLNELNVSRNSLLTQLYCGGQRDDMTMHVTMTSAQKEWWDKDYVDRWENTNVEVIVKDAISGGNGSLGNFGSGGEF